VGDIQALMQAGLDAPGWAIDLEPSDFLLFRKIGT
jgi:hypothetical protein